MKTGIKAAGRRAADDVTVNYTRITTTILFITQLKNKTKIFRKIEVDENNMEQSKSSKPENKTI